MDEDILGEIAIKMGRVQSFLRDHDLAGVLLGTVRNYSWITAGIGNNRIELNRPEGAVALLILRDGRKFVITNGSEADRVMDERLGALGYQLRVYSWYEANALRDVRGRIVREITGTGAVAADMDWPGTEPLGNRFARLRYSMTEEEILRYEYVGEQAAEAVEAVCRRIEPGMDEYHIEAMAAAELRARGLTPTVLLIGVDQRIHKYRHTIAAGDTLQRYAMVNVCAEKWGLTAAVTRLVHFGPVPEELRTRLRAAAEVHARIQHAARPGTDYRALFRLIQQSYAEAGFPGEWKLHHQGGPIGYQNRELVLYPEMPGSVQPNQPFACNPTVTGAKVEDTFIATEDGPLVMTDSGHWPMLDIEVEGTVYPQPDILVR